LKRNVDPQGNPANWRVQVTDPVPAEAYVGLTVLSAMPRAAAAPAVDLVRSIDDAFVGVEVGGAAPKVVALPRGVETAANGAFASPHYGSVRLTTGHAGTATYLIGGLIPGQYSVERDGRPIGDRIRVDSDGLLFFSASAGTVVVQRETREFRGQMSGFSGISSR
jgi:hypothetical protein